VLWIVGWAIVAWKPHFRLLGVLTAAILVITTVYNSMLARAGEVPSSQEAAIWQALFGPALFLVIGSLVVIVSRRVRSARSDRTKPS
jgi:hypothetical protein